MQSQIAENTDCYRLDANRKLDPKRRSELGQFMTPGPIAGYMASLFRTGFIGEVALLDPGSGVGSLSSAFIEEFCSRESKPTKINATAYEVEPVMLDYLKMTFDRGKDLCCRSGVGFESVIHHADFIEEGAAALQADLFQAGASKNYSHVIANPPYKKINSASKHRKLLRSIDVETSNLYTGFLSVAIKMLRDGGEMVAIVPRSFCNGPYFRPFRELFLREMGICRLHVFESRSKAFKGDDVLQENIIFHAIKGEWPKNVVITSSPDASFSPDIETGEWHTRDMTVREVPYSSVVKLGDPQLFIHIATTDLEQQIFDRISVFDQSLEDLGVEISTGPVVDFRLRKDLAQDPEPGTVPLLYPTHFQGGNLEWPKASKKPNAIHVTERTNRWLWKNEGHFVVTRRFTSKEEKRRVVAAVYDSSPAGELVGFENHLNVFHLAKKGLPETLALGLAIYLNSSLVDRYFRQFNGHTQVNATDLRILRYPRSPVLRRLAKKADGKIPGQQKIDQILEEEISTMAKEGSTDPLKAQQKIDDALAIVRALGMPKAQHNERSALTLLAILNLRPEDEWSNSDQPLKGITPIMEFCAEAYGKQYAPNTRETFRRQTMHQFVDAGIALYNPDKPDRPVNSPKACYQISQEAFEVIISFGTDGWEEAVANFLEHRETLVARYAMERDMNRIPVQLANGEKITLTPGAHSQLIKDIIIEFGSRYAPGSEVIYVGDTGDKAGYFQRERLEGLGVTVDKHGKMPDVVLYYPEKKWLLLVESVTSHGPVDGKRHGELSRLFAEAMPGLVYVTAFPDRSTMAKYLKDISWETEVWVADAPTHLIHFNGDRFLGPHDNG